MAFVEIHISQKKAQFSTAYIHALASFCGLKTFDYKVDDESVDVGLSAKGCSGGAKNPRLEIQLKCTSKANICGDVIKFVLKEKNYVDLSDTELHVPKILVLVVVDDDHAQWMSFDIPNREILLRTSAYWMSLAGHPPLEDGQASKQVEIPLAQEFNDRTVIDILYKVGLTRRAHGEVQNDGT